MSKPTEAEVAYREGGFRALNKVIKIMTGESIDGQPVWTVDQVEPLARRLRDAMCARCGARVADAPTLNHPTHGGAVHFDCYLREDEDRMKPYTGDRECMHIVDDDKDCDSPAEFWCGDSVHHLLLCQGHAIEAQQQNEAIDEAMADALAMNRSTGCVHT